MQVKTKSGRVITLPTDEEDKAINAGMVADPDTYEPSGKDFKKMGRPKQEVTKERITIRLSPDVLAKFKETGAGWQTRIDEALKEWLEKG